MRGDQERQAEDRARRDADALDRAWDALLDRAPAQYPPDVDPAPDPTLLAAVHDLRALHDAPAPDPTFLRQLREDLMQTHPAAAQSTPFASAFAPTANGHAPTAWLPPRPGPGAARPRPRTRTRTWSRAVELLAVAALVLAILGGTVVGSGGLPAFLGVWQDDAESGTAMFLGNAARTGEMPGPGPEGEPGLRWRADLTNRGGSPTSSPIVADGVAYTVAAGWSADGSEYSEYSSSLVAFDAATGESRWRMQVNGLDDGGSPAVADGLVYIGTSGLEGPVESGPGTPFVEPTDLGALVAFDAATGGERWRYATGRSGYLSPSVSDGTVYIGSDDGTLHAVDAATGEGRWTFAVPSAGEVLSPSSPAVAEGAVYIASSRGVLHAVDAASGEERWQIPIGGNYPTTPVVADGAVYVGASRLPDPEEPPAGIDPGEGFAVGGTPEASDDVGESPAVPTGAGRLYAFDAANGDERWAVDLDRVLRSAPAIVDDTVYVAGLGAEGSTTQGAEVLALDAASGAERWSFAAGGPVDTSPAVADGTVYVGSFDAFLYAVDAATGDQRWRIETGDGIAGTPFVADGTVFVGSLDGNLYAIGGGLVSAGTPLASPIPTGDASGLGPCDVEPRPELAVDAASTPPAGLDRLYVPPVSGTPVASVVPVTTAQEEGQPAGILPEDVPSGEPADAETIAGIAETLEQLAACSRPGRERQIVAFYTDDYFRRPAVATDLRFNGYAGGMDGSVLPLEDVRELPDGRIGVLDQYGEENARFYVFVAQEERWLIDEVLDVSNHPDARG